MHCPLLISHHKLLHQGAPAHDDHADGSAAGPWTRLHGQPLLRRGKLQAGALSPRDVALTVLPGSPAADAAAPSTPSSARALPADAAAVHQSPHTAAAHQSPQTKPDSARAAPAGAAAAHRERSSSPVGGFRPPLRVPPLSDGGGSGRWRGADGGRECSPGTGGGGKVRTRPVRIGSVDEEVLASPPLLPEQQGAIPTRSSEYR